MKERIEDVLQNRQRYDRKECMIGSLLTIDDDDYGTWCCNKCEYVWRITHGINDYVCLLDIDLDLDEVR